MQPLQTHDHKGDQLILNIPASFDVFQDTYAAVNFFLFRKYAIIDNFKCSTVVRELLANAIRHGSRNNAGCIVTLTVRDLGNRQVSITVEDEGRGFAYQERNFTMPAEITGASPRGLALVGLLADTLHFHGCGNQVEAVVSV